MSRGERWGVGSGERGEGRGERERGERGERGEGERREGRGKTRLKTAKNG